MQGDTAGKAAEERNGRIAEEQERRDEGHEQEVLYHMGAEEGIGETIERRADGYPDGGETEKEGGQPPCGEGSGTRFADGKPATVVDGGGENDRRGEEERG